MKTSAIVSISTLFSGKSKPIPENSSELGSTAVAAISGDQDIKNLRISRLIPNIVGRQLESKIVVCSTEDGNYAILTVPEYRQSEHVNGVLKSLQDRYPKKSVSVHTASPVTLMSLAKSSTETKDVATRAHTNYEMVFESIVQFARKNRASDITLTVHKDSPVSRVSFKIEGKNITPDLWAMPTERMSEILNILWQKVDGGSESFWNDAMELQGIIPTTVDQQEMKLRFQSIAADRGPSVTMRVLEQNNIRPLEAYEYLPSHLALLVRHKGASNGLIVFAGKVGSGKTTSITALIATLPPHYKIFMIEDPVEIIVDNAIQCTVERKMDGSSDSSFKSKLFSMKRNAPDAVSLGEIRDPLTGNGVVEVGGMGTLGLFTIHAAGMLHIPERMWSDSIRIPKDFLASPGMLKLLVYQALVHRLCTCAEPLSSLVEKGGSDWNSQWHEGSYWEQYTARIQTMFEVDSSTMKVRSIDGCEKCRHEHFTDLNGYNSRTVIAEMMEPNSHYEMLKLIAQGDTLGLYEFMDKLPRSPNNDPDMTNKNVVECGIYKALIGQVDPRDIERATESFESLVLQPRYAGKFK